MVEQQNRFAIFFYKTLFLEMLFFKKNETDVHKCIDRTTLRYLIIEQDLLSKQGVF